MPDAHHEEIAKLESLYEENPHGRVFTHLAEAYRRAGELERARQVLSDGIGRHPDYSSAHVVLGRVLIDQDRTGEAEEAFQRVLDLDPHNLIAIRSLGDLARSRGDHDQALEYYHRLLDQEPGEEEVREIVDEMTTGLTVPEMPAETDVPEGPWGGEAAGAVSSGEEEKAFPLGGDADQVDREPVAAGEPDAEVRTETIAQVYARQGLYDRAAEVYRELVRSRPDDVGLRERLSEVEQLAAAQTGGAGEIDAVSDLDVAEAERLGGLEPTGGSGLPEAEDPQAELEPELDPEPEPEPEPFTVEGLQPGEVDTTGVEATALPGIEVDESDPETGLRADVTPDAADPDEDLSDEIELTDVPQPPEEAPWSRDMAVEDTEAAWLDQDQEQDQDQDQDQEAEGPEVEGTESVWTGADWRDETEAETTPHAWTDEEDEEDASPPIREYLGGLLSWPAAGGSSATDAEGAAEAGVAGAGEAGVSGGPGVREEVGPGESVVPVEPLDPVEPRESMEPADSVDRGDSAEPEEDDDLDMFRSWLESLKQ